MKVRWTAQTLRIRITPSELVLLEKHEKIEESISFPRGERWRASIVPVDRPTRLTSSQGEVAIELSTEDVHRLSLPDLEGVYFTEQGGSPQYIIEKDFPCIHPRDLERLEPPTETFEPPLDFVQRKVP